MSHVINPSSLRARMQLKIEKQKKVAIEEIQELIGVHVKMLNEAREEKNLEEVREHRARIENLIEEWKQVRDSTS